MHSEDIVIFLICLFVGIGTVLGITGGIYILYRVKHPHKVNLHESSKNKYTLYVSNKNNSSSIL